VFICVSGKNIDRMRGRAYVATKKRERERREAEVYREIHYPRDVFRVI